MPSTHPLHIVLFEPEIPQNTGNIARLCAAIGASLHLIEPLGFFIDDPRLKRAGLDYWSEVEVETHRSWQDFLAAHPGGSKWLFTTKAVRCYADQAFAPGDFLVFGPETRGLPAALLGETPDKCLRLPMRPGARSLNLSNSAAIAAYEALRQMGFPGLAPHAEKNRKQGTV